MKRLEENSFLFFALAIIFSWIILAAFGAMLYISHARFLNTLINLDKTIESSIKVDKEVVSTLQSINDTFKDIEFVEE